jgi:hypothetical protein
MIGTAGGLVSSRIRAAPLPLGTLHRTPCKRTASASPGWGRFFCGLWITQLYGPPHGRSGGVLPGQAAAMERELVGLGVSDKVKDRARQTFERSAEQAGFFAHGRNRLVMPGIGARQPDAPPAPDAGEATPEAKKNGAEGIHRELIRSLRIF